MEKLNLKLELAANFINSISLKQKLIIWIGKNGVKIIAYHKRKVVDSVFVDYGESESFVQCCTFLKKYKNFEVLILLDSLECRMKHEFMPMLQSIIKFNPIEKFIEDNYKSEDIVAYNISNIDSDSANGEVWETVIASAAYSELTSQLLEFVIYNSFRFNGIYFLSLEFEPIISEILKIQQSTTEFQNDLQIFATVTQASDIKIAVKFKKNILDALTIDFPSDKSDLYIAGTVEQAISDQILKYREYSKSLNLKICLIFLCSPILSEILPKMPSFAPYHLVTYSNHSMLAENGNQHFQDSSLLQLFMENKKYPGLNKLLRSINKLTAINSSIFKPLFLIIIGIILFLASLKYQSIVTQKETILLNNEYYLASEKYRNIKKRHPEVENITDLAELYNLEMMLNVKSSTPVDLMAKVFSLSHPNIKIANVNWYAENMNLFNKKVLLSFDVIYVNTKKEMSLAERILNNYANEVKLVFENYEVTAAIKYDNTVEELPKTLTVLAKIMISTKIAGV